MGTGSFPGVKFGWGVLLTTHPLLVPQSWKTCTHPLGHTGPVTGSLYLISLLNQSHCSVLIILYLVEYGCAPFVFGLLYIANIFRLHVSFFQGLLVLQDQWGYLDVTEFMVQKEMREYRDAQVYLDFQVQRVNQGWEVWLG